MGNANTQKLMLRNGCSESVNSEPFDKNFQIRLQNKLSNELLLNPRYDRRKRAEISFKLSAE